MIKKIRMTGQKSPMELGTGNIKKLLIEYSGAAIVAMMASSLYNIIDRVFIGQWGGLWPFLAWQSLSH